MIVQEAPEPDIQDGPIYPDGNNVPLHKRCSNSPSNLSKNSKNEAMFSRGVGPDSKEN